MIINRISGYECSHLQGKCFFMSQPTQQIAQEYAYQLARSFWVHGQLVFSDI